MKRSEIKRAFTMLHQTICKKCSVKSCDECLYLEEAMRGETKSIVKYVATPREI